MKKIVKVWSMTLAMMLVAAKVEVATGAAAAAAAAAAVGMFATILVLLVANGSLFCFVFLSNFRTDFTW